MQIGMIGLALVCEGAAGAKGLNILKHAHAGASRRSVDAETTPLRHASRGECDFANRLLSAMRYQFGGHVEPWPAEPTASRS
jgi:6-phosphogluconate dehydrogenase (decarboxylating)